MFHILILDILAFYDCGGKISDIEESDIFMAASSAGAIFITMPLIRSTLEVTHLHLLTFDLAHYSTYICVGYFSYYNLTMRCFFYSLALFSFMGLLPILLKREPQSWKSVVDIVDKWYIPIQQVLAGLLLYKYIYSPEGTEKPGWTEQLG